MLTISKECYDDFAQQASAEFEQRALAHVKKVFPSQTENAPEEALRLQIREQGRKCAGFKITTEYDVIRFIDLSFLIGPHFDAAPEAPWIGETLHSPTLAGWQKMERIWSRVEADLNRAAKAAQQTPP